MQYIADSTFLLFTGDTTGQKVKVIVTDFIQENVFSEIEDQLKDLNIGVLGWTFSFHVLFESLIASTDTKHKKKLIIQIPAEFLPNLWNWNFFFLYPSQ